MRNNWHPKLGDKFVRRPRVKAHPLRRVLGIPGLFGIGYGNVGSSIYYALGIVAVVALGATPVVLAIAGIFFVFHALSYAEGTAMIPEAGGSASFARHGFNDSFGFIAGWALAFSYIVTIAISAFIIPSYLGYFWPMLKESAVFSTAMAMGIIFFLMCVNVVGVRGSSVMNFTLTLLDLVTQLLIIGLALLLVFTPEIFLHNVTAYWPTTPNLIFGVAIAAIAFTGIETMSQMAEETKHPEVRVPRALLLMAVVVLVIFGGISVAAFSTMAPPELASEWAKDPVAGIAQGLSLAIVPEQLAAAWSSEPALVIVLTWLLEGLRTLLPILVAILATTILLVATNAGLMGISRLTFSLGRLQLIPPTLSRVHHRFKTPYVAIILFALIAILLQSPGFFAPDVFVSLGGLYAFGSLLAFALAHASILSLRIRKPELPRPFKIGLNIRIKQYELPITAILGLIGAVTIWVVVLIMQPYSRWVGFGWMAIGFVIYLLYRWRGRLPLGETVKKISLFQGRR